MASNDVEELPDALDLVRANTEFAFKLGGIDPPANAASTFTAAKYGLPVVGFGMAYHYYQKLGYGGLARH